MRKLKRILTLCLAIVLAVTALGTISFAEEGGEMRKLSVICRDLGVLPMQEREKNLCYQEFARILADMNIEIEYELIDNASIADAVRTRMAAQVDIPDMVADAWIGVTESEVISWAQNGLLVDIRSIVEQYDEDGSIFAFYEEKTPGLLASQTMEDGGVYWFSYLNAASWVDEQGAPFDYQGNSYTVSLRADWLEKADVEYKKVMTHQELFDALVAIQEADPNGNGVKDEVADINIAGFANGIARSFGLSSQMLCDVHPETGKIYNSLYQPEFLEYIVYMQKLYQAGLYDTTALGTGMIDQMIIDNKASLVYSYAGESMYEPTISDPDAVYAPIMLASEDGTTYSTIDPLFGAYCHYTVTTACDDLEAIVDLFDYIYTDEYALLCMKGIEGLSFKYNEIGMPVSLFDSETMPDDWEGRELFTTCGLVAFPAMNTLTNMVNRKVNNDYRMLKNEYANWFQNEGGHNSIKETFGSLSLKIALPTNEEQEKIDEIENVLSTYMSELLTDLILGNRPVEALPEFIEEMESLGLTDYLNIMQARRDRFIAATGVAN